MKRSWVVREIERLEMFLKVLTVRGGLQDDPWRRSLYRRQNALLRQRVHGLKTMEFVE